MKTFTTQEIQDKTITFLADFYRRKYRAKTISSTLMPRHIKNNSAIDVLLNFDSNNQKEHTVVVETKSGADLQSQLSFGNYKHPLYLLAAIFAGIVAYFYFGLLPWYGLLGITAVILISLWGIIKVVKKLYRENRTNRIIKHLENFPSNEKWIAITNPGLEILKKKKSFSYLTAYNHLISQSIKKKIGVLMVTPGKVEILQKPMLNKGQFLEQYVQNESTVDHPLIRRI